MPNSSTLLLVGDAQAPTGFTRVVEGIFRPLAARFDLHQLAVNYFGDPHEVPWKLYPAQTGGDAFGVTRLPGLVDHLHPDLIFILAPLPGVQSYLQTLGERAKDIPIVAYSPVEAEPIPPERPPALRGLDCLVFFTEFARLEFAKAVEQGDAERRGDAPSDLRVMPHGVNTSAFFPIEPDNPDRDAVKRRIKHELFRADEEHSNSFVVLNANRNQPRKRIDTTVQGFAEFARDKDRFVKLHLHMGTEDLGWKVVDLCRRFGIFDRLIMTNQATRLPAVSSEKLNRIYNAADVGINTSSSEGWGLVSFEHAATRTAQVVPRHASCAELWTDVAEMLSPAMTIIEPQSMTDQYLFTPEEVAARLEGLYADAQHRHAVADRCYAHATRREFDWDHISGQWEALLSEFLK